MFTFALAIIVLIGIYFLYNQLSNLNLLLEKIITILKNNKVIVKENSDKIIDDIYDTHNDMNKSMFDPETIISKLVNPSNAQENLSETNNSVEEELKNNDAEQNNIETASTSDTESIEELNADELGNTKTQILEDIVEEKNSEDAGDNAEDGEADKDGEADEAGDDAEDAGADEAEEDAGDVIDDEAGDDDEADAGGDGDDEDD